MGMTRGLTPKGRCFRYTPGFPVKAICLPTIREVRTVTVQPKIWPSMPSREAVRTPGAWSPATGFGRSFRSMMGRWHPCRR